MKNNKICVGLDIGTTKIVALVGKKNARAKESIEELLIILLKQFNLFN